MRNLLLTLAFILSATYTYSTIYYYDGGGSLTLLSNWGVNSDGSGSSPICFCGGDEFRLTNTASATLSLSAWAFTTGAKLVVGDDVQGDTELTVTLVGQLVGDVSVTDGSKVTFEIISLPTANWVDMHPNGTVEYIGTLLAIQVVAGGDYGNLTFTGGGVVDIKELPDSITVTGDLTLDAELDAVLGSSFIEIQGDLIVLSNFDFLNSSETKTDFLFSGTNDQTISSSSGQLEFKKLTSTKTGGVLTLSNTDLTLNGEINLEGAGGVLDPGSNQIIATEKTTIAAGAKLRMSSSGFFVAQDSVVNSGTVEVQMGDTNFSQTGAFVQLEGSEYVDNGGTFEAKNRVGWTAWTRYTYWSSPITTGSIPDIGGYAANYYYEDMSEGDEGWKWSSHNMEVGRGYALQESGGDSAHFVGIPNNGDLTGPQSGLPGGQSEAWSFLGNPYPSPINAKDFLDSNSNINGAIYIWDQSGFVNQWGFESEEYAIINGTGASWAGNPGADTIDADNFWISPFQGFFVEGVGTAAAVTFDNGMRDPALSVNPSWSFKSGAEKQKVWFHLRNESNQLYFESLLGFLDGATEDWDNLYDASPNSSGFHLVSMVGEDQAVIQGLPQHTGDEVILWEAKTPTVGTYTFTKDRDFQFDVDIWLKDLTTQGIVKISEEDFVFTETASNSTRYFEMYFKDPEVGIEEEQIADVNKRIFVKSTNGTMITEEGNISVYDIQGRIVQQYELRAGNYMREFPSHGIHLVKFENNQIQTVKKFVE